MFDLSQMLITLLAAFATGGLAWVFIYPYLSGEAAAAQRLDRITESRPNRGRAAKLEPAELAVRKRSVEESLKKLEERNNAIEKRPPLNVRIEQAGLSWSRTTYLIFTAVCGVVGFVGALFVSGSLLPAIISGASMAFVTPRAYLNRKRSKRFNKFLVEFPNALDVIVRGVKAGLPVTDCIRICAQESAEPVRSEFRQILESQSLNVPLPAAVEMMYQRVPLQETNFFSIVITIQQKSGGNLSEILGNLSKVLRERKKLKAKVRALSQEAIASASIIGLLPLAVMLLLYLMNPTYIELLWTRSIGQIMLAGAFIWMAIGAFVMRKMINFEL